VDGSLSSAVWWRLCDRTSGEAELDFLATLVVCDIWDGNTLHAKYLDLVPITTRKCVFDTRKTRTNGCEKTAIMLEGETAYFSGSSL
jgi:hypothetical protein